MSADKRYSAHLGLELIGVSGQERIRQSRVGLIGLGGLGCAVAQYLVSSGVGSLSMFDFDTVAESNLARQFLYRSSDVGARKVDVAKRRLSGDNPHVEIGAEPVRVDQAFLEDRLATLDLLIDASDNYGTRRAANRACIETKRPWVMGAAIRLEGQVAMFEPQAPCYMCIYSDAAMGLEDCTGSGIFAPVAGIIGTTMGHLALMRLAGLHVASGLWIFDGAGNRWQSLNAVRRPDCPECGKGGPA